MAIQLESKNSLTTQKNIAITPKVTVKPTLSSPSKIVSIKTAINTKAAFPKATAAVLNPPTTTKTVVPLELKSNVTPTNSLFGETTTVTTGKYVSVTPNYTEAQLNAIKEAQNRQLGTAITSTAKSQQIISLLRAGAITKSITQQGYELAPKGTKEMLGISQSQTNEFRDMINAFQPLQEEWATKQAGYLSQISQNETLLAKATSEGAIAKGQLTTLTGQYNTLYAKYQELLNKPPSPDTDIFGGIGDFINKYGLFIVLGVGALIFMPLITKLIPGGKE